MHVAHLLHACVKASSSGPTACLWGIQMRFDCFVFVGAAGSSSRSKFAMDAAAFGGAQCGALTETTPCVALTCTDCAVSAWSGWSDCTVLCGSGLASRARSVTTTSVGVAQACNAALTEAASCNTAACTPAPTLSPSLSPTQSPTTPRCDARSREQRARCASALSFDVHPAPQRLRLRARPLCLP